MTKAKGKTVDVKSFTFQSGSIQILRKKLSSSSDKVFTFQSGSIQIYGFF